MTRRPRTSHTSSDQRRHQARNRPSTAPASGRERSSGHPRTSSCPCSPGHDRSAFRTFLPFSAAFVPAATPCSGRVVWSSTFRTGAATACLLRVHPAGRQLHHHTCPDCDTKRSGSACRSTGHRTAADGRAARRERGLAARGLTSHPKLTRERLDRPLVVKLDLRRQAKPLALHLDALTQNVLTTLNRLLRDNRVMRSGQVLRSATGTNLLPAGEPGRSPS
jgi:hypothetical protein